MYRAQSYRSLKSDPPQIVVSASGRTSSTGWTSPTLGTVGRRKPGSCLVGMNAAGRTEKHFTGSSQVRRRKSAAQSGSVAKVLLKSLASAGPSIHEALDEGCRRGCITPTRRSTTHSFSSSLWRLEGAMPSALWIKSQIQGLCAMRHGMAFSNRLAFSEALPRKQRKPCARDRAAHGQEARSAHRIDDPFADGCQWRWHDLSHGRLRPLRNPVNQLDVIAEWRGRAQDDAGHWRLAIELPGSKHCEESQQIVPRDCPAFEKAISLATKGQCS